MRFVAVLVAAIIAVLAGASAALAHASLIQSEPADRAVLAQPPPELKLTFNEPVSPLVLRLVGPGGEIVDLKGTTAGNGGTIVMSLPAGLISGTHLLSWRVTSADGHPVGGSLAFSIGQPSEAPALRQASADPRLRGAIWLARLVLYVGLFVGIGGAFYGVWMGAGQTPRVTTGALVGGLIAAFLSFGLHGVDLLGLPAPSLRDTAVWANGFASTYGSTLCIAIAALALGLAAVTAEGSITRWYSVLALIALGTALASSGHAATAGPAPLTRPAIFLHGVCVAFWVGALIPLGAALRAGHGRTELARFSKMIPWPLALLIASGVVLAIAQLRQIEALWTTPYGLVLSGKIAAVCVLLALGAMNRWHTPAAVAGRPRSAILIGRSVQAELVIVALILGLVASWRFTPPPRALLVAAGEPIHAHIHAERAMADLQIGPPRAGDRRITFNLLDGQFRPLAAKEVTLVLSQPQAGIEPLRLAAHYVEATTWQIDGVRLPISGRWLVRIEILINDFEKVAIEDQIDLAKQGW